VAVEDAQQSDGEGAARSVALIDDGTGVAIVPAPPHRCRANMAHSRLSKSLFILVTAKDKLTDLWGS